MAATNRTAYALLGLLAQGPKTGYEIKQVVERTISHFWKESYGHIYPTLKTLIAEGQVVREAGAQSGTRQRYQITAAGQAALAAWLAAPLEPEGVRNELALKLYFGSLTTPAVSKAHLVAHREHHQRLLARFAADKPEIEQRAIAGDREAMHQLITLALGMHISTARIAWCDEALGLLEP